MYLSGICNYTNYVVNKENSVKKFPFEKDTITYFYECVLFFNCLVTAFKSNRSIKNMKYLYKWTDEKYLFFYKIIFIYSYNSMLIKHYFISKNFLAKKIFFYKRLSKQPYLPEYLDKKKKRILSIRYVPKRKKYLRKMKYMYNAVTVFKKKKYSYINTNNVKTQKYFFFKYFLKRFFFKKLFKKNFIRKISSNFYVFKNYNSLDYSVYYAHDLINKNIYIPAFFFIEIFFKLKDFPKLVYILSFFFIKSLSIKNVKRKKRFFFKKKIKAFFFYNSLKLVSSFFKKRRKKTRKKLKKYILIKKNQFFKNSILNFKSSFTSVFFNKKNLVAKKYLAARFNTKNFFLTFNKNYNNFYPLFLFLKSYNQKRNLFSIKRKSLKTSSYYTFYLLKFLEVYTKKKIFTKIFTKSLLTTNQHYFFKRLALSNIRWQKSIGKILFLNEFYEIFFLSLKNRDLPFLCNWFKKKMEKLPIHKHKKLSKLLKETLYKYPFFAKNADIAGFSFDIRGKLGVSGNAKKRHFFFYYGVISNTSKNHGMVMYQTTVRTYTGVLGVTMYLTY